MSRCLKYPLILASGSPRRRQLLELLDVPFEMRRPQNVQEYDPEFTDAPADVVLQNARKKVQAILDQISVPALILGADTLVYFPEEQRILSKPATETEAIQMLKHLQGRTHIVYTAVVLFSPEQPLAEWVDTCEVTFMPLTEQEIEYYVRTYRPLDKAGAYGAQDWIGVSAIQRLNGNFYTVMGLPVHRVWQMLRPYIKRNESEDSYALANTHPERPGTT